MSLIPRRAIVFLATLVAACGSPDSEVDQAKGGDRLKDSGSTYAGLAFTTVDRGYTASTLWHADLATGSVTSVSTGESGDPWLTDLDGSLHLFNRVPGKLNLRSFDLAAGTRGDQVALDASVLGAGDPHAALVLGPARTLLALNVAGKLVVIDPTTGQVSQTVAGDFDVGDGPFRPEAFLARSTGTGTEIFVLHQGLGADSQTATGRAQVFVLADDGEMVTTVDLDTGTAKIQGIPLASTDPLAFVAGGAKPLVVGLCMPWIQGECTAAAEALDLDARTASVIFDFSSAGYVGNGGIAAAGDGSFYAAVVKDGAKQIVKVVPEQESVATVHTFPEGSAGCCALFADDTSRTLYVGDFPEDGTSEGLFTLYDADGASRAVSVDGRPYTSQFITK